MRSVFVRLSRYAEAASSKFGCLLSGSFAVSVPVLEQGLLVEADLGLYCGVWVLHCVVRLLLLLQRVLRVGDGLPGWEGKRRGVVAMLHSAFGEHVGLPSVRREMVMECLDSGDEEEGLVYIICNQGVKGSVMRATHHR